jgi:Uncharacterized conserved protein
MLGEVQTLAIIVSVIFNIIIIAVLRKWTVNMRYSLPWLGAGIFMLLFSIFPNIAQNITKLFKISQPINTLFFFAILFIMIMLIMLTITVANLKSDLRKLTQITALLQKTIKDNTNGE